MFHKNRASSDQMRYALCDIYAYNCTTSYTTGHTEQVYAVANQLYLGCSNKHTASFNETAHFCITDIFQI